MLSTEELGKIRILAINKSFLKKKSSPSTNNDL